MTVTDSGTRSPRNLPLILGSSSRWRRKVLESSGRPFEVMTPDIDEKAIRHADPRIMTVNIALAKAAALLPRITAPSILVTTDQVAVFDGRVREKPKDGDEARRWLADYGLGRPVSSVTAVVVVDTAARRTVHAVDVADVWFEPIAVRAVEAAIAAGVILHSCGAFAVDEPNIAPFVSSVRGTGTEEDVRTSIEGLPLRTTLRLIDELDSRPA